MTTTETPQTILAPRLMFFGLNHALKPSQHLWALVPPSDPVTGELKRLGVSINENGTIFIWVEEA